MKSRSALHHAFIELEGRGYVAPRKAWQCCQGCVLAALPEGTTKYVFYHQQDFDRWKKDGVMYLAWGGDADEIKAVLTRHGVDVEHANPTHRIRVGPYEPAPHITPQGRRARGRR